jgi:hypothetical protein
MSCRPPLFWERKFEPEVIIACVRWYLRFCLSQRFSLRKLWRPHRPAGTGIGGTQNASPNSWGIHDLRKNEGVPLGNAD